MPRFEPSDIRRYYDRQTAGFLALGQGGGEGAIHRAVWGPGVTSRAQAFHFVEDQIAAHVASEPGVHHVVDLGCGVGGSLAYLATRLPIRGTGITVSPVQARLGMDRLRARGLADRVTCLEGDFTDLPRTLPPADLAFAIESFVHGPSPEAFFREAARVIRPGGWLVVCDDARRETPDARATRTIERFREGWHVNTLLTRDELVRRASDAGFVHARTTDLTPWLELDRPRDRVIAVVVALAGRRPLEWLRLGHLVGGDALRTCLRRGWVGYDLSWFTRA